MKELTYLQEFYMCVVKEEETPEINLSTVTACFVVGGVMELIKHSYVSYEQELLTIAKPLSDEFLYLQPLYNDITKRPKWFAKWFPKDMNSVAKQFHMEHSNQAKELLSEMGKVLFENGMCEKHSIGKISKQIVYIPKTELVDVIIQKLRHEFLNSIEISDKSIALMTLLVKCDMVNNYFNPNEMKKIEDCLTTIRQSEKYQKLKSVRAFYDELENDDNSWLIGLAGVVGGM